MLRLSFMSTVTSSKAVVKNLEQSTETRSAVKKLHIVRQLAA